MNALYHENLKASRKNIAIRVESSRTRLEKCDLLLLFQETHRKFQKRETMHNWHMDRSVVCEIKSVVVNPMLARNRIFTKV